MKLYNGDVDNELETFMEDSAASEIFRTQEEMVNHYTNYYDKVQEERKNFRCCVNSVLNILYSKADSTDDESNLLEELKNLKSRILNEMISLERFSQILTHCQYSNRFFVSIFSICQKKKHLDWF